MRLNCIIIEDEPLARDLIVEYVDRIDLIKCVADFSDALSALNYLKDHRVDLIFLDLHLPKLKGLEFIKQLETIPKIIITTAHNQYALESYDYPVVDYLLKPIEFLRFEQAIKKLFLFHNEISERAQTPMIRHHKFIRIGNREVKIFLDDVLYIESELEYLKIFGKVENVLRVRHSMQSIQEVLSPLALVRIHRSFLVVPSKVTSISSKVVSIDNIQLPIGRQYKAEALRMLKA